MENDDKTLSLGEIFKIIFKRKWWVLCITLIFTVAFSTLIEFVYNRQAEYYSISYGINYPDISSGNYPDGTNFRVSSLVSLDTLNSVKENGGGKFDSVNLQKMVDEDDISIKEITEITLPSSLADITTAFTERRFTITMSAKYFKDSSQAVDFIRSVAKYPVDYVNGIAQSDYNSNLDAYEQADTYESKINFLSAQSEYLQHLYAALISNSSADYKVNNKTLNTYLLEVSSIFNKDTADALKDEALANHFVVDAEGYLKTLASRENVLNNLIEANQNKIDALKAEIRAIYGDDLTGKNTDGFNVQIAALELENAEYRQELKDIEETRNLIQSNSDDDEQIKWTADKKAFDKTLSNYCDLLRSATEKCKAVRIAVFGEKSYVEFDYNRIKAQGGIHIVIAVIVGLIIGFVLSGIIICAIDVPKYLKKRNESQTDKTEENN